MVPGILAGKRQLYETQRGIEKVSKELQLTPEEKIAVMERMMDKQLASIVERDEEIEEIAKGIIERLDTVPEEESAIAEKLKELVEIDRAMSATMKRIAETDRAIVQTLKEYNEAGRPWIWQDP